MIQLLTEDDILLHTFRDGEMLPVKGQSLQGLLQHKNNLLLQKAALEDQVAGLRIAMGIVKKKLTTPTSLEAVLAAYEQ